MFFVHIGEREGELRAGELRARLANDVTGNARK